MRISVACPDQYAAAVREGQKIAAQAKDRSRRYGQAEMSYIGGQFRELVSSRINMFEADLARAEEDPSYDEEIVSYLAPSSTKNAG